MILFCFYLEWSHSVRLFPAQIKLAQNGQAHKEPVAEAVVVNESENILHTQVDQGHGTLHSNNTQAISEQAYSSMKDSTTFSLFTLTGNRTLEADRIMS